MHKNRTRKDVIEIKLRVLSLACTISVCILNVKYGLYLY
jgi:hypothetical protein